MRLLEMSTGDTDPQHGGVHGVDNSQSIHVVVKSVTITEEVQKVIVGSDWSLCNLGIDGSLWQLFMDEHELKIISPIGTAYCFGTKCFSSNSIAASISRMSSGLKSLFYCRQEFRAEGIQSQNEPNTQNVVNNDMYSQNEPYIFLALAVEQFVRC
jgi:hypothetical protein